jgi:NADPH:quinone reductase-like Zn-dependent oxidoreductase
MKAMRFHEYGDPAVLRYEDVEQPVPGAGQVRIRVAASAFNPVDDGIRGGYLQGPFPVELPHTPGIEVSGTVDAVGEGVDAFAVGDEVVGFLPMTAPGSAAEHVVAPVEALAQAPAASAVPLADAAALPMVGLTAWQALFTHAEIQEGQRVLINGAGGAVGGYAVQLAKRHNAYVIASASGRSAERVKAFGADDVIDHTATPVTDAVTEPVDALINLARITAEELVALMALVKDGGVLVNSIPTIATPADEPRGVRGIGLFVTSDAGQLNELVSLVDDGALQITVTERVPLTDLADVHARSAAGTLPGKTIILP